MNICEVMIKSITNFLIIFFIFQHFKSQISSVYQNGVKPFCDKTLHIVWRLKLNGVLVSSRKYRPGIKRNSYTVLGTIIAFVMVTLITF